MDVKDGELMGFAATAEGGAPGVGRAGGCGRSRIAPMQGA